MLFYLYAAVSRNQALLSLPLFTLRADVNILSGEIPRIVALGQETIYPVFLISLAILLSPAGFKTKLIYGLLFFVAAASIVVNGFRSYWYATAFASVVVFLLSLKVQRKTVEKIFFPVAFFVILAVILAVFFQNFLPQTLLNYMWERASSIFVNGIQDPSASFRLLEWRWGLQKVLERPVFGWGVSFPVKPATLDLGVNNGWLLLHSGYLDLLLYYGFVGILVFIFVYLNSLRYAYNILKRITGASQKSLVVAFLGYMVLLLIVAIANPTFAEAPEVILLNIGFALMVFLGQDVQRNSIIRE
jgi:O-antigen ligase